MTKALFFDIDGTLVSFETHRIPSSTIEALEAARAGNHRISFSPCHWAGKRKCDSDCIFRGGNQ